LIVPSLLVMQAGFRDGHHLDSLPWLRSRLTFSRPKSLNKRNVYFMSCLVFYRIKLVQWIDNMHESNESAARRRRQYDVKHSRHRNTDVPLEEDAPPPPDDGDDAAPASQLVLVKASVRLAPVGNVDSQSHRF
jgi:hypothetical protein